MKFNPVITALLLLSPLSASVERVVNLGFENQPKTTVTLSISTGGSSSQEVAYDGSFDALLKIDPRTLKVEELSFLDGSIGNTQTRLGIVSNINYTELGTFSTSIEIATTFTSHRLITLEPPGHVDPITQELTSSQHQVSAYAGIVTTEIAALGEFSRETTNLGEQPIEEFIMGVMTITTEPGTQTLLEQSVNIRLQFNMDQSISEKLEGTDAVLTSSETGTIEARGSISIPNPLGQWAIDNEVSIVTGSERNQYNLPYLILFALDLPTDSSILPIELIGGASPAMHLRLPQEGLKGKIVPRFRITVRSGFWDLLPTDYFKGGPDALSPGSTGVQEIAFPDLPSVFVRLSPADPFINQQW